MLLYKVEDFNPNYRTEAFDGKEFKGLDVYAGNSDEKIGTIDNGLVDETGRFRYFVVDTGFWIFGKKVLVPVGLCRIDFRSNRVYATGLRSKEQAERLPRYEDGMSVDYDYEEQVRNIYRTPTVEATPPVEASLPVESSGIVGAAAPVSQPQPIVNKAPDTTYDRQAYTYEKEPAMYQMNEPDHQELKLYEERLVTSKSRRKAGEVTIGKHVETETVKASVPVEKERVIIERKTPTETRVSQTPRDAFQGEQTMRMEVYEETPEIRKETFVREEINVRKEVARDTVEVKDTVRREELDLDTEGSSVINEIHSSEEH
ncbi:DUF2382 domain-containing protein [Floridanema aerugineum]|jgi:uncharacterized protein (TIGR02271 family)|uniref:DUF2382 domain-containing protein n=1 Tax=Floridaenema aerugineum BLCC-F46 TaxID=3153654 RepID=A0ABV4X6M9_9CYAN